jgi:hypothetical protein
MNLKIAKAFRTTSSEALCVLTEMTPIITGTEQEVKQYTLRKGKEDHTQFIDREVELKHWPHPADAATIVEAKDYEDQTITLYTDASKSENGV